MHSCVFVFFFFARVGVVLRRMAVYKKVSLCFCQAIWLLCTGAREAAFRNIKTIAECLADELINAAKVSILQHSHINLNVLIYLNSLLKELYMVFLKLNFILEYSTSRVGTIFYFSTEILSLS